MKLMQSRPPKIAEWLLNRILRRRNRSAILGDLEEIYSDIRDKQGPVPAQFWYWFQIMKSLPAFLYNTFFWSLVMFRNYIKISLRNIRRHKGYFSINIIGLAIGITGCLLISLWVLDELSYDRFHAHADLLYRVEADQDYSGNKVHIISSPTQLAPALEEQIPEVRYATRFTRFGGLQLSYKNNSFYEQDVRSADPSFFKMFSFPLLRGDIENALNEPFSIVVSERMAEKYFSGEDPIGKIVKAENEFELIVTGVIKNAPSNSTLRYDWIVPFIFVRDYLHRMPEGWVPAISTFVQIRKGSSLVLVNEKITQLIHQHQKNKSTIFFLNPLTRLRLHAYIGRGEVIGNVRYVYIFSLISFIVLLIACINFINLSTARSAVRAREIGMRKVVGAQRSNIIRQFYGESFIYTLSAFLLAVLGAVLLLPLFNQVSGKQITLNILGSGPVLMALTGILIFTTLVAGSYPALLLSAFRPVNVLRSSIGMGRKRSFFRKTLVVMQFSLSIFLIIGTGIVFNQVNYMKKTDLGYDKEHLVLIPLRGGVGDSFEAFKNEIERNPYVLGIMAMSRRPTFIGDYSRDATWDGKDPEKDSRVIFSAVTYDFVKTLGIELVAGRDFSADFTTDATSAFLINEETARLMDKDAVVGANFSMFGRKGKVIGIMKNFHFQPLRRDIEPLVLLMAPNPRWLGNIVIRIQPQNISSSIAFLEETWKKVLPVYPFEYTFLDEDFDRIYWREQRMGTLLTSFAFLAVFVACLGLLGLASFTAEQRTKEIGIRKVLGASVASITFSLCRDFAKLVALANIIAWPVAYLMGRDWLHQFAYRVPLGWPLFVFTGFLALFISILTVGYQAVKSARANPVKALQYE